MAHATPLEPYRWTREQYDRLVDFGLLDEDARVELLDGVIVEVSPEGSPHASAVQALIGLLAPVASEFRLRVASPLWASEFSEPQPDLAITRPPNAEAHPSTARLAIEVVVTERAAAQVKIGIYAAAGVDEYWIVDVPKRVVEVFTKPTPDGYAERRTLRGDDLLTVPEFGIETAVAEVFRRAGLA